VTNFSTIDDLGTNIRIVPYQPTGEPHECARCPPNLCKGGVLDKWIEMDYCKSQKDLVASSDIKSRPRIIYIGDGGGDVCPALRLGASDVLLCRQDWALHKSFEQIRSDRSSESKSCDQSPRVVPWKNGADILRTFQYLYGASAVPVEAAVEDTALAAAAAAAAAAAGS
jgi:hypothetical protein